MNRNITARIEVWLLEGLHLSHVAKYMVRGKAGTAKQESLEGYCYHDLFEVLVAVEISARTKDGLPCPVLSHRILMP